MACCPSVVAACLLASALASRAEAPRVVAPDPAKLLMLDTRVVERAENARLVLGSPVKDERNPLLPSDQPWENATNNYYPNVLWDAEDRLWKLWYKDVLADKEAIAKMDSPSTVHDVGWYLLYATSRDGLAWERPALGLHKFGGSSANNIVARDCPNVGVFKDPRDPDPARRYKMVHDVGLGKPRVRFSPDGIRWGAAQEVQGFGERQGDTHNNAFFDARLGKYLWFTKLYLGERLVTRLESDDFLHWKSSGLVLRSTLDEGRDHQTYALTVFPYASIWLGYLMMYHVGRDRTVDCELAWSPDSVQWRRVQPGKAFLPLGAKGSYDGGCIYAQAGPPVVQEGRLLIYYGGSPTAHLGWKRSASLCLARLREDGFAFYEAEDPARPAVVTTTPLKPMSRPLRVIADGAVVPEELPGKDGALRLRLTLQPGAKLYAIQGAALVDATLPAPRAEPLPRVPARKDPVVVSFDRDAEGWKGVDALEHHKEGYVTISRAGNLRPIAYGTPLEGDWPTLLGGDEVTISARLRAPKPGGAVRLELFARDLAQWTFEKLPPFAADWQTVRVAIRYDWTDAQARAAGWAPSPIGFSWRDTVRHAGRLVIMAAESGAQERFDLDEVRLEPR
ncbi:MAG TPA: hypothetical protein PLE19_18735 [Planctomycetota bacterium]|nr:hypothetical protein [Planctomycetota bacterium]HRR81817.1 hypothetical protein [Planctomycetota bacterium]HRT97670.1 hypothetical protein [Planctomycetota bacterium]